MDLPTLWFCIIGLFWLGYLFLEGFDFGVGMLLPVLGRDDTERRVLINTIGPVWDGNEVWLIVAAGATFAAFPAWYAGLFSAAYLPLLLVLLTLIGRGVAFDYRGKVNSPRWRAVWDRVIVLGSCVPPFGIGLLLATTAFGVPLDADGDRVGTMFEAVRWETLLGGLAVTGFSLVHGAVFLALKTDGRVRARARRLAIRLAPAGLAPVLALLVALYARHGAEWAFVPSLVVPLAGAAAVWRLRSSREGQAFAALGVLVAAVVVALFGVLYPDVLPSTLDTSNSLTVYSASSGSYTLEVLSWLALFGTPAVLVYQGWTYWVFRTRIGTRHIPKAHT